MTDPNAQTFGLPPCLRIPIAAVSVEAIRTNVGVIVETKTGPTGRINAVCVQPHDRAFKRDPRVKLWKHPEAAKFAERLHPPKQVWVHVDYDGYRDAYIGFGMPPITPGYLLDHVQNRKAIRLRLYSHPYLRLCPVSRSVNTSGGINAGGEGMEKSFLGNLPGLPQAMQDAAARAMQTKVVYADPMDITKMLDIPPGTETLPGVRDTQALLYPN
jgi:hypothetical protein